MAQKFDEVAQICGKFLDHRILFSFFQFNKAYFRKLERSLKAMLSGDNRVVAFETDIALGKHAGDQRAYGCTGNAHWSVFRLELQT